MMALDLEATQRLTWLSSTLSWVEVKLRPMATTPRLGEVAGTDLNFCKCWTMSRHLERSLNRRLCLVSDFFPIQNKRNLHLLSDQLIQSDPINSTFFSAGGFSSGYFGSNTQLAQDIGNVIKKFTDEGIEVRVRFGHEISKYFDLFSHENRTSFLPSNLVAFPQITISRTLPTEGMERILTRVEPLNKPLITSKKPLLVSNKH